MENVEYDTVNNSVEVCSNNYGSNRLNTYNHRSMQYDPPKERLNSGMRAVDDVNSLQSFEFNKSVSNILGSRANIQMGEKNITAVNADFKNKNSKGQV